MRKILIALPLLLCASPALAQEAPPPQLPPELTDPAMADRLARTAQALGGAVLDMRVGGMKAALEGRVPSPGERNMTVRDLARRNDPNFDRHLQQQVATVGPKLQQSIRRFQQALPEMMQGLADAERSLDRALANLPDPTYPRR
jgi:hypothetical protein